MNCTADRKSKAFPQIDGQSRDCRGYAMGAVEQSRRPSYGLGLVLGKHYYCWMYVESFRKLHRSLFAALDMIVLEQTDVIGRDRRTPC